jgi:hypothetical protein
MAQGDELISVGKLPQMTSYRDCERSDRFIIDFWRVEARFNADEMKFIPTLTRLPNLNPEFRIQVARMNSAALPTM